MSDSTKNPVGYAQLSKVLLEVWPYLPEHHLRLLPLILSYFPNAFPAQALLARRAGVRRQAVNTTIRQMADAGLLVVTPRTDGVGGNDSCLYSLPNLEDVAVRERIIAWYCSHYPDTPPVLSRARQGGKDIGPSRIVSGTAQDSERPVASPRATPPVASWTVQPLSPLDATLRDNSKRQEKKQTKEACGPVEGAVAPGGFAASPAGLGYLPCAANAEKQAKIENGVSHSQAASGPDAARSSSASFPVPPPVLPAACLGVPPYTPATPQWTEPSLQERARALFPR